MITSTRSLLLGLSVCWLLSSCSGGTQRGDSQILLIHQKTKSIVPRVLQHQRKVVEQTIRVDQSPLDMALGKDGRTMYLTHHGSGTLAVLRDGKVLRRKRIGRKLTGIAMGPGGKLWIGIAKENRLVEVDPKSLNVLRSFKTEGWPLGVRFSHDKSYLAVTCARGHSLMIFRSDTMQMSRITTGRHPFWLAITRTNRRVLTANYHSHDVSVIDITLPAKGPAQLREVKRIRVGKGPVGIALSHDGWVAYTANYSAHTLSAISMDELQVIETVKVGRNPYYVATAPGSRYVMVTQYGTPELLVIDPNGHQHKIRVKNGAVNILLSPDGRRLYLSNFTANTLSILE